MEKFQLNGNSPQRKFAQRRNLMKFFILFLCVGWMSLPVHATAQKQRVTLDLKDCTVIDFFRVLQEKTSLYFVYNIKNFQGMDKIDVKTQDEPVGELLKRVFSGKKLDFEFENNTVVVKPQQQEQNLITIKGKVTDEKGNSMPGVTVLLYGTTLGVSTDEKGHFTINAKPDAILRISFIGYKTENVFVEGRKTINVSLKPEVESLEEVTVVAFGTQKKESVVSAITTVRPMDLKTSSSDLTSSFAGKIAGMIGWQTGGMPGALTEEELNTKFYIRGITSFQTNANVDPLILIDGVESSKLDLSRMAPEDIESFSVLKDASATAMYGARGANGVILVTTRKGEEGSVYTSVRYEAIMSMPTREIEVADPIDYMRMYNEALITRDPKASPQYDAERISRTISGKYPSWVYPANDWYGLMFKDYSVNHHMGLNIRGGSRMIQYFASLNYNRDEGMLKTDRLNEFDCNIKNNTFGLRTNLNIDLAAGIRLLVNMAANLDKYHGPHVDMRDAYYQAFNASPVDFAPLYPGDKQYAWPHLRFGGIDLQTLNPYRELQRGYRDRSRYSATMRAEYIHNLSQLVKGLELRASMSLNKVGYYDNAYITAPLTYRLDNYDFETGEHKLVGLDQKIGIRTLTKDKGSSGQRQSTQLTYEVRGLHTAAWGDHQTSLTGVFNAQENTIAETETVLDGIPQRNMSLSMRGTYGFRERYFIEASFGYNGSERFAKDHRWGFFPAVGGAWIASKERFLAENTSQWLPFLKFRASWGKVGNDGIISSPRFTHLQSIAYKQLYDPQPRVYFGQFAYLASYPNAKIKWEIAEQINLGLETKWFDGIVEMNADFYQEIRHNILDYRYTIPETTGLEELQLANVGRARARGVDLSAKVQHAFSPDFWIILNGTYTYSKAIYQYIEEASGKPDWQRKKGQELSQSIGYIAEGLFYDQAEIDAAPMQGGDLMPGDIRYRDLNGDGMIDVNDATYIGYPQTPRVIYGFSGFINYKNWEFSFAFQGSGKRSFFMNPAKISPFTDNRAMLKAIYDDHWSEDNMSERPFWPRLSTYRIDRHNPQEWWGDKEERKSTYFMRECRFLRCTSIELAYNLPEKLRKKLRMKNVKFYARTNNPFLITNFKVWDVELGDNGFNYPIQRTYSLGLNISF